MNKETIDKFFKAIKANNIALVKLMLYSGIIDDVNIKNVYGSTALMLASNYNDTEMAKFLLSFKDIDVNDQNDYGITALMLACFRNNTKIVTLLLSHKDIDVNITNIDGHAAIKYAKDRGIRALLKEAGAKE